MKRTLKGLHTFGAIGTIGGFLSFLVLGLMAEGRPTADAVVLRQAIDGLFTFLIVPSVGVTLVSGLLSMAVHAPFHNAAWVWLKLATTVVTLEGSFGLQSRAREVGRLVASGAVDHAELASLAGREKGGLAMLLFLASANVVLGVWRPRFKRRTRRPATEEAR